MNNYTLEALIENISAIESSLDDIEDCFYHIRLALEKELTNQSQQPLKTSQVARNTKLRGGEPNEDSAITNGEMLSLPASSEHSPADTQNPNKSISRKGCGKKMDALGYIICGEFDDLKNGGKQWLCDDCKSQGAKK